MKPEQERRAMSPETLITLGRIDALLALAAGVTERKEPPKPNGQAGPPQLPKTEEARV